MADSIHKVITIDTSGAVKSVDDLNNSMSGFNSIKDYKQYIDKMQASMLTMDKTSEEYSKTANDVREAQERLNSVISDSKRGADAAEGSYNALSKQMAELKKQWKATADETERAELGKKINSINDQLKSLDGSIGNYQRNVGNYSSAFTGGLGKIGESFKKLKGPIEASGTAMGGLLKSATALLANPIAAAIAAVVFILKQLKDAIGRNEEATASFNKILVPFKTIWIEIQRHFDKVAEKLGSIAGKMSESKVATLALHNAMLPLRIVLKAIMTQTEVYVSVLEKVVSWFSKLENKIESSRAFTKLKSIFDGIINTLDKMAHSKVGKILGLDELADSITEYRKSTKELEDTQKRIADMEVAFAKASRESTVNIAKRNNEIAKLRAISENTAKSEQERLDALEAIEALQVKNAEDTVNLRRMELQLIKDKNSLTNSGTQDLAAEANAEAALINAETELQTLKNANIKLQNRITGATRETAGAARELTDEQKKAQKAYEEWAKKNPELVAANAAAADAWTQKIIEEGKAIAELARKQKEAKEFADSLASYNEPVEEETIAEPDILESIKAVNAARMELMEEGSAERYEFERESMQQIADLEWIKEQARLEAEGYGDEQIETLRQAHYAKLDKQMEESKKKQTAAIKQQVAAVASQVSMYASSVSGLFDSIAENFEEGSKQAKAFQIMSATINMLAGVATAVATAMQLGPIAGPIVGAINAAAVVASGVAQITKIKKTSLQNPEAGGADAAVPAAPTAAAYTATATTNYTGQSESEYLANAVGTSTAAAQADQRVYVVESDIREAGRRVDVRESEADF